jgi:hypothetical protein
MPPGVETFHIIYDRTGFRRRNLSMEEAKAVFNLFQQHYPERLGVVHILFANWVRDALESTDVM